MIKRNLIFVVTSLVLFTKSIGQTNSDFLSLKNFTPPSPESAAMERYGDIPVDLSSGLVQISVPIYEVKSRQLSLPISLSYHASGIKVQDMSTPVGLGWVLNAGGSVSRNVVGKADENGLLTGTPGAYYRDVSSLANSTYSLNNNTDFSYLSNIVNGGMDAQSDIYHFNTPGISGKFVYDDNFNIQYQPVDRQLSIQRTANNQFNITDDAGVLYKFTETENTEGYATSDITTWHLTEMKSADNTDVITFEYINAATLFDFEISQSFNISVTVDFVDVNPCTPQSPQFGLSENTVNYSYQRKLLSRINFAGGYVLFDYVNDRQDPAPERLDMIKVFRTDNTLVKQVKLTQDYFITNGAPENDPNEKYYKRLRLNQVEFKDASAQTVNKYSFEYNQAGGLPPYRENGRKSLTDYWGYSNGASAPAYLPTLLPSGLENEITNFIVGAFGNANNSAQVISQYQQLAVNRNAIYGNFEGMLKKITFPTGGTSEFEYEKNSIASTSGSGIDYVGGYRIKKITTNDPLSQISKTKTYEYSTGIPVSRILPYSFFYQTVSFINKLYNNTNLMYIYCTVPNFTIVANPVNTINYYNGSPVIYEYVTEYDGTQAVNNGKTEFQYDVEGDATISSPYWTKYMYLGADKSWARGGLLNLKVYKSVNNSYSLLKETVNTFSSLGQKQVKVGQICELVAGGNTTNLENYFIYHLLWGFPQFHLLNYFDYADVVLPFGVKKLVKTEEFDYLNNTVINKKEFFYESPHHLYTSKIKDYTSIPGEVDITELRYPQDRSEIAGLSSVAQSTLTAMEAANIKVPVIETKTFSGNSFLKRDVTEYADWNNAGRFYPKMLYRQLRSNPLEPRVEFLAYDDFGNLTSQKKVNDVVTSYIWGYGNRYPVAGIIGKSPEEAISQSGLNLAVINNPSSESALRTELNKLYSMPGALVTTYIYKPLIGLKQQTDARGKKINYEYDAAGRLSLVLDNENKVLKKICYNYAGQPENCAGGCINFSPDWQNTSTPLRCQQGTCGNTGYQEQEQRDMNPCSPTYNQVQWLETTYNPSVCALGTNEPNWQNTSTPPTCQQDVCGNTGYQLQEQKDMNPCSPTYNQTRIVTVYNTTACPVPTNMVNITYSNACYVSGFTAVYTSNATGQQYTFNVPSSGTGILGCIPSGRYSLTISKPGNMMQILFGTGCWTQSGTSATFGVSILSCNQVTLENDL